MTRQRATYAQAMKGSTACTAAIKDLSLQIWDNCVHKPGQSLYGAHKCLNLKGY